MVKQINMIGLKFGRLFVKSESPYRTSSGERKYICICDCGKHVEVTGWRLRSGQTKSCGCYRSELASQRMLQYHEEHKKIYPKKYSDYEYYRLRSSVINRPNISKYDSVEQLFTRSYYEKYRSISYYENFIMT